MRKCACTDLWCAGLNRHEVGNERVLQEMRERIHPDRESCDKGREAIVESGSHTVSRGSRSLGRMTKRNRMAKAPAIFLYPAIRLLKFNALWKGGR